MDFWTYAVMLGMLVLAHVQFVIMLIEVQKVLSQILWMWAPYMFTAVDINKYIV